MRKWVWVGIWFLYFSGLAVSTFLGISSYFVYTTFGFDFEELTEEGANATYYRVRFDDGSVWVGMATHPVEPPDRELDWFDPGGTVMDEPTRPRHPHWINDWGFWWITDSASDPFVFDRYGGATVSYWVGAPSWLFLLLLWLPALPGWWRLFATRNKPLRLPLAKSTPAADSPPNRSQTKGAKPK